MQISYDYYRVFYYVAAYQSFTRAAEILMNNQPNLTRIIKNLESTLGCTLFVRSGKGVTLTPEGEKLYLHISAAFDHIQTGEQQLLQDKSLERGIVSVAAGEKSLSCFLLPVLREFRRRYPGIQIRISNDSGMKALEALGNKLVDLAVVAVPAQLERPFVEHRLKRFREAAVCGGAFNELIGRQVTLRELNEHPIICLGPKSKTYKLYSDLFLRHGLNFSPMIEAATSDQILPMVKNDLGIGFVPEEYLEKVREEDNVFVLDLKEEIPERFICLVERRDHHLSMAAKMLRDVILENIQI